MRSAIPCALALFIAFASSISAQQRHARESAAGCVTSTLICNTRSTGEIAPGDCTDSRGYRYDVWQFSGSAGQFITLSVRPLDASMTNPTIELGTPVSDGSKTPIVGGAGVPTLQYALSSTGTWTVWVGSLDLFASGRYEVSLQCTTNPFPSLPQNCVTQPLGCNQGADWFLTASSCRFASGDAGGAYAYYELQLNAGDFLIVKYHSDYFRACAAIYRHGGNPIAGTCAPAIFQDVTVTASINQADKYQVAVYGAQPTDAGEFYIATICNTKQSTCEAPKITQQPVTPTVPYGGRATLTVAASGDPPLSYAWYMIPFLTTVMGTSQQYVTAPMTQPISFFATVSNACGTATTIPVTVIVLPQGRRRTVRH